jgi:hypothetical protein
MNIQTLKSINKALAESGENVKLKLKNAKELKTGNFILKDMWCGVLMQVFYIDIKTKEIKKGNFFDVEGKTKFGFYKDFQTIKF